MVADLESREFLVRIYELLRNQQESLFQMYVKIQSLEMAVNTNQSFAKLYRETTAQILTPELKTAHEASVAAIGEIIRQLRSQSTGLN